MKKGSVNYEIDINSLFENMTFFLFMNESKRIQSTKGWQTTQLDLIFPMTMQKTIISKGKKNYFLTAPAIAAPRKAIIARYKVITIYRKNPETTAGM
jgi:hypothetical protein